MAIDMDVVISLNGLEELRASMEQAVRIWPNKVEESIEESGKELKKEVIQETKSAVNRKTGNLIKGFKLDKMQNYGIHMEQNFRGTAPHFHLIENGHEKVKQYKRRGKKIKDGGKNIGFVPGRLIVGKVRRTYKDKFYENMQKTCDEILKESKLT